MPPSEFKPGFRFSILDGLILLGALFASCFFFPMNFLVTIPFWFVLGHFFLFCNVFRLGRDLELIWAGVFVATGAAMKIGLLPEDYLGLAVGVVFLSTIVVLAIGLRRPSYHGVGWQILNPHLPEWWASDVRGGSADK